MAESLGPLEALAPTGRIHIQVVGVNEYPTSSGYEKLSFAVPDAADVLDHFAKLKLRYPDRYVTWKPLYNEDATRKTMLDRMREIATSTRPEDVVLFYLSGHGSVPAGHQMFYFLPFDVAGKSSEDQRKSGLSTAMLADMIRELPARRILLLIDACQSGGTLDSLARLAAIKVSATELRQEENSRRPGGAGCIRSSRRRSPTGCVGTKQAATRSVYEGRPATARRRENHRTLSHEGSSVDC